MKCVDPQRIALRPIHPDDARLLRAFFLGLDEETAFLQFGPGEYQPVDYDLRQHIKKCLASAACLEFVAVDLHRQRIAGHCILRRGQHPRNRHCGELGLIVSREYWGQGLGSALLRLLLDEAARHGGIRKINLAVRADNTPAINLYARFGFVEEGRRSRDSLEHDIFYDCLLMGLHLEPLSD